MQEVYKSYDWYYSFAQLGVSVFSAYSVFSQKYLYENIYFIFGICFLDFIMEEFGLIKKMKNDMWLHRIFVICIISFFFTHSHKTVTIEDIEYKNTIITNIVSTEISTIFLVLNNILRPFPRTIIVRKINNVIFIPIFLYYRTYNYMDKIIFVPQIHQFIFYISDGRFHTYYMYVGIFGLFAMNIYWTFLIIQKIARMSGIGFIENKVKQE